MSFSAASLAFNLYWADERLRRDVPTYPAGVLARRMCALAVGGAS